MTKRVVSRRRIVEQDQVGTTLPRPTGSTGEMGQRRVYAGTGMSNWTCNSCGTAGIPGDTKSCPQCGSSKGQGEEYQPPAGTSPTFLSPEKLADMGVDIHNHESDEQCPFCDQRLKPGTQVCTQCGGNVVLAARTSRECQSCGHSTNAYKCPNCGSETVNHKDVAPMPRFNPRHRDDGWSRSAIREDEPRFQLNWKLIGVGLAVVAVIAIAAFLWPREERATISASSWTSTVYLQEYQYNQHSGWAIPSGGVYVSESSQFHHNESVYDHTENQCHMETVPDGYDTVEDEERVCESVYQYTDEVCYDDGTCDYERVYEDECHMETTSRQVPRTREERVCEDVRIYRDEPRYAQYYVYNIWEWVTISPAVLSGTGSEVLYPTGYLIDDHHRETGRAQTFSLTFLVGETTYSYTPTSLSEYQNLLSKREWIIVRRGNTITEIKPSEPR